MVSLEMEWTQNWFRFQEECWRRRLEDLDDGERESGLRCYCYKQMALWRMLGDDADQLFGAIRPPDSEGSATN